MIVKETYGLTEFNAVLEIPIYRLNNSLYESELTQQVDKSMHLSEQELINTFGEKGKFIYAKNWTFSKSRVEYNWKFNEIIGWITIHLTDGIILGEIFLKKTDRITKNSKAKISFSDCGFKIPYNKNQPNKEIYKQILKSINDIQADKKFRKKHIDKTTFETLGPFINWKKLYESLND